MKLFHKKDIGPSSEHMNFLSNVSYNSNNSSSLATVVWKESCVTSSVRCCNSEEPKKFKRTLFFCSSFNHLSKTSVFSRCNASYTILSPLTPLLYCFPLIMLSIELIPLRVASMLPAAPKCFLITAMKIHDAWKPPILKFIKFFSCIFFGSISIKRALQYIEWSRTKSASVFLNASALAFTWSRTSNTVFIFVSDLSMLGK